MGKQEKYYWHGKGAILIGKQTYAKGEEIPADKIEKKRLKMYMDKGDISTAEVEVKAGASETVIQSQYKELKAAHTKLLNAHEKLKESKGTGKGKAEPCKNCPELEKDIKAKADRITELEGEAEASKNRIAELEKDIKAKADRITELEGEAEASKNRIAELEKQVEQLTNPEGQ
jgi:chromosome segregation ATPase